MSRATVVVLGDIGRSPRMCYHSLSLAQKGIFVDLVGYTTTKPHDHLINNANIRLVGLPPPPDFLNKLPAGVAYGLKFLWTAFFLLMTLLFRNGFPSLILMQNPPGIPCMAVCHAVARIKRAKFAVDWHNYTWTILRETFDDRRSAVNHAAASPASAQTTKKTEKKQVSMKQRLIKFAEWWESYYGPKADWNLCVTHAMRADLLKMWNVKAVTLYDRPPSWIFKQMDDELKHQLFVRLATDKLYEPFWPESSENNDDDQADEGTRFSLRDARGIGRLRNDRPALLISSTSWTIDEDFGILLDALVKFDGLASDDHNQNVRTSLPKLVAVITGKGPQKAFYMDKFSKLRLNKVEILTPWLDAEDYPKLLACADVGVSLHMSTSGLDLPMKVVDMFGCGLPVLAKRFHCIDELVKEGENGHLFDNANDLCDQLVRLLQGFPLHSQNLSTLRKNLMEQPLVCWEDNWDATVYPLVRQ